MKLLRLLSIVVFIAITANLYCQTEEYMFNHFKSIGDKNVIYFKIEGLSSDKEEQDRVLAILLEDETIYDGNIYSDDKESPTCQITAIPSLTVRQVRNLLQSAGYDIDLNSLANRYNKTVPGVHSSGFYPFSEFFDGYKNYDPNTEGAPTAEEHYASEKEKWVTENPEEYKKAKQSNGTTVIVKKKDLDTFTAEKRNHILSHPEIFIIEE
jgi:hypothetical protein